MRKKIYLAGPDVFHRTPLELAARKKELCHRYGFEGLFPLDNMLELDGLSPYAQGLAISAANEKLMRACDVIIANMTPFRGPNTDSGTAYEIGFMRALGKPVLAYMNLYPARDGQEAFPHHRRVQEYYGQLGKRPDGSLEDPRHHMQVENFNMADNLMLDGAVAASGSAVVVRHVPQEQRYTDLAAFEECLQKARDMAL